MSAPIQHTSPPSNGGDSTTLLPDDEVKQCLHQVHDATLCTLAAKPELEGYPFGSVVPYVLDAHGAPVVFIAKIASHTSNLTRDPRATLFVRDDATEQDPQTSWRVGVMGRFVRLVSEDALGEVDETTAMKIATAEYDDIAARYFERVPAARTYATTHQFSFWRMGVERVRFIGGFGRIFWLNPSAVLRAPISEAFAIAAKHAVDHMNTDHVDNMVEMCRGREGIDVEHVKMTTLDPTGFTLQTDSPRQTLRFSFGRDIGPEEIRGAVIDVLKNVRRQAGAR